MSETNNNGSRDGKNTSLRIRKNHQALRDIVEKQKLRRVVRVELKSCQEVSNDCETITQSASQKVTVSCGSQTCSLQTEIHREQKVFTESSTSPPKYVEADAGPATKQIFVTSDSFAADGSTVPPLSPGRSRSESGNRTRLESSVPVSKTPPHSPRTPRTPQTPSTPKTPSRFSQAPRSPRSAPTSPSSAKRQTPTQRKKSSPLRQINCGSESGTNEDGAKATPKKSPRTPKKFRKNDEIQVKPLVNTYHIITEKPHIRARKGAPKELLSSNVKEIFSWIQTREEIPDRKDQNKNQTSNHGELISLVSRGPEGPLRSTAIPQASLPLPTAGGFSRHVPVEIIPEHDFDDQLSDEEYKTIRPTRKCAAKPLVNTSFHPSPPKRSKDAVMMFVSISGDSSVPEKAQLLVPRPPTIQKYHRAEVLAFMKRKRLERRQQNRGCSTQNGGANPSRGIPQITQRKNVSEEFSKIFDFEEIEQPRNIVPRVLGGAHQLSELFTQLYDPRSDQLETLLAKFEDTISAEIHECNVSERSFEARIEKYASTKLPLEERLEDATRRLNSFLMNSGLRESCSASTPRIHENSVVSGLDALTPSRSVRVSSFLSSLEDTPRPKSRNSPPNTRFSEEERALQFDHRTPRRDGTPQTSNFSLELGKSSRASAAQLSQTKFGVSLREEDLEKEPRDSQANLPAKSFGRETPHPISKPTSRDCASARGEQEHFRSDFDDPNFIFEWRQKYLKGSAVDSSTPRRNFTEIENIDCDPNVSRISAEKAPAALNVSSDASETVLSDIDDSALKQAREVLRQLDSSRRNLEKTQKIISEMESKHKPKQQQNDSNNNLKNTSDGRRSRSRNSTRNSNVIIEGDDILEEAKRVLREINSSSDMTNKSNRSNASRNLIDSFDKIFENEAERHRSKSTEKSPKKSFAPGSLSNLATNELDFLEDCNDTLLKISEVSRAKNYAFARETNMANEFLRREFHKTSTPVRSEALNQLNNDEMVDELRRSLQEAFDKIENQSKEMSRLRKDLSTSRVDDGDQHSNTKSANVSMDDVGHRQPVNTGEDIPHSNERADDHHDVSQDEHERSRSSGSTSKTVNDTKSGSVSFETTSLTDEKPTDSTSDGSEDNDGNSHSVSPETPSRSSLEKSLRSSPTASTVKTEVPKSPSTVSTLKTEIQKSPEAGSPQTTDEAPKITLAQVETARNDSRSRSSPDTLNSVKSTADTISTGKSDENDPELHHPPDQQKAEAQTTIPAVPIAEQSKNPVESSDSALILALINYIERREHNVHGQRSENLKKLRKLATTDTQTAVSRGNETKMQEGKDQRKDRNELQKLIRILAKQKIHSKSSSSSDQQTNTSSDESSEILTEDKSDQENDAAKTAGSSSKSHSIVLGTNDLIEHMDLVKLLIKRNNEISQKEKFVKYLERERQKIERRSEAIKKREAKLMADMKAAVEREVNTKMQLFQDALVSSNEKSQKSESQALSLRPLSARKFRSRKDSSGSEDVASLSETDASDIEGSKRALKDEEERETRQLEKLKRDLETPDSNRRPGRKEMLMRRIEVLEKLLANNRAAVAMLESSSHVMPKIRKPKVAVQERSQESEESDASRDGLNDRSQQSKLSVSESETSDAQGGPLSGEARSETAQQNVSSRSSSSKSLPERSKPSQEKAVSSSSSSERLGAEMTPKVASPETLEADPVVNVDSESSRSESLKSDVESARSKSSEDSENTKNRKVDSTVSMLVTSLKEDTLKEVVKATKLEGHATNLMERLVDEAVGAMNKAKTEFSATRDPNWDEFSPISSLNGTLAEIGQQIFVDDASQQVCIRTIPNKPPPPYTPPKVIPVEPTAAEPVQPKAVSIAPAKNVKEQRQPEPVVPMTLGELQTEASHAAEYLFEQLIAGRQLDEASYEDTHCQGVADMAKVQYGEMLFDVAKETAEKLFRVGRNSDNMFSRPLPSKERHQAFIDAIVGDILKSEKSKSTRPKCIWSYINNRRMDYIDFIMGKEIREEEKEWTEYTGCLEQVNEQLVEQVFAHIVETNVAAVIEVL